MPIVVRGLEIRAKIHREGDAPAEPLSLPSPEKHKRLGRCPDLPQRQESV